MRDDLRRRQAYLAAMGITAWYPRFLLPGAPPPLEHGGEEEPGTAGRPEAAGEQATQSGAGTVPEGRQAPVLAPGPSASPGDSTAAAPADVRRVGVPTGAGSASAPAPPAPARAGAPPAGFARRAESPAPPAPAPSRTPASPAATPAAPERATEAQRFRLVFLACGQGLGVVAQLPHEGQGLLGAARRDLLAALLQARVGLALPPDTAELPFHWPLGPNLDASAEAARAALSGFLGRQAEETGCRMLLVLGERLAPLLLDGREAQRGIPYPLAERPWRLLFARSLDEVLALPALKRELWRDLAPLAGASG